MVVIRRHRAALQDAAANYQAVGQLGDRAAQSGQHFGGGAQPVGFLKAQSARVHDTALALRGGGYHRQHGNQVGNGRGVDFTAVERAATDKNLIILDADLRTESAQDIHHGPVALPGFRRQIFHADAPFAQRTHAQKERAVGVIALHRRLRRRVLLRAEHGVFAAAADEADARLLQSLLRHSNVGGGFHPSGYAQGALAVQ